MNKTDYTPAILLMTAAICGGLCFLAFGLFFSPGWANEWPFGLHRNVVWPAGLAIVSFATVMVGSTGALVAVRYALSDSRNRWPPAGVLCVWLLATGSIAATIGGVVYEVLRPEAGVLWP